MPVAATSEMQHWVNTADIVGGFATLAAALIAAVAVPIAFLQGNREKQIARADRLSQAVHSYLDRRQAFYDDASIISPAVDDDFDDMFFQYERMPNLATFLYSIRFTIDFLKELWGSDWHKAHRSVVDVFDQDLQHFDRRIMLESVYTYMRESECWVGLESLNEFDAFQQYEFDEGEPEFIDIIGFANRFYEDPPAQTISDDYRSSEAASVRFKRRLVSTIIGHYSARDRLKESQDLLDQIRSDLGLAALHRHSDDFASLDLSRLKAAAGSSETAQ